MVSSRLVTAVVCSNLLAGCGLEVPDIQEYGGRLEGQRFVQEILINITCELREAFTGLHERYPKGTFIDDWGVQMTLSLSFDEKGTIAPGVSWVPGIGNNEFTLGAGLDLSSAATRTNKINAYFLVSELQKARCSDVDRPNGAFLLQSNLKLSEWLFAAMNASERNAIKFNTTALAFKENVLQHQVKFTIATTAAVTPTWELTRFTANTSGDFFSASRTRTHDLLITMAPAVKAVVAEAAKNGRIRRTTVSQPIQQGAELHFSTSVATSIETGIRNALQRQ
jgi:hypothetical protein